MSASLRPPGWRYAACRKVDPEIFFPDARDQLKTTVAKTICAGCPILTGCRSWAEQIARDMYDARLQMHGIWGGLSETDRDNLFKVRAACGTNLGFEIHRRRGERTCPACRKARNVVNSHGEYQRRLMRDMAALDATFEALDPVAVSS